MDETMPRKCSHSLTKQLYPLSGAIIHPCTALMVYTICTCPLVEYVAKHDTSDHVFFFFFTHKTYL